MCQGQWSPGDEGPDQRVDVDRSNETWFKIGVREHREKTFKANSKVSTSGSVTG